MQRMELPLASPWPTTAPSPHDVNLRLLQARQNADEFCGWIDSDSARPITCYPGDVCGKNTFLGAVACCHSSLFPSHCGPIPTACVNSAYVADLCSGFCLDDPTTVRCTLPGREECVTEVYNVATLPTLITGWACDSIASAITAYDSYSVAGGGLTTVFLAQPTIAADPSESVSPSKSSSTSSGPSTSQNTPSPVPLPGPTPSPSSSSLSGGAIAGIAIGAIIAVAIIVGLIALLFIQHRKRDKPQPGPPTPNTGQMIQTNPNSPPTSPSPNDGRTSFMSNPSATSATPLTQNNIAAVSQTPSDLRPQDSASNTGGFNSPVLSQNAYPAHHSSVGSPEHSGIGPLPGPQYPTGSAAFPNQNASASVMSPGSAFGSMPPGVHAPGV